MYFNNTYSKRHTAARKAILDHRKRKVKKFKHLKKRYSCCICPEGHMLWGWSHPVPKLPSSEDQLQLTLPIQWVSLRWKPNGAQRRERNGVHASYPHLGLACCQDVANTCTQAEQTGRWEMVPGWTVMNVKLAASTLGSSVVCTENTKHWYTQCVSAIYRRTGGGTEWRNAPEGEQNGWKCCSGIVMTRENKRRKI